MSDRETPEWERWLADLDDAALARAIGAELARDPNSPVWHDSRFLESLGRRSGGTRIPADMTEDDAHRLEQEGEAMLKRIEAKRRRSR